MKKRVLAILTWLSLALLCLTLISAGLLKEHWKEHPIAHWSEGDVQHKVTLRRGIGYVVWQPPPHNRNSFKGLPYSGTFWGYEYYIGDPTAGYITWEIARRNPTGWAKVWQISYSTLAMLFAILPIGRLCLAANRHWLARRASRKGLCIRCGYDLRASPDYCPECGDRRDGSGGPPPAQIR